MKLLNLALLLLLTSNIAFAQAPAITAHPISDTICVTGNKIFGVTASNTTSYQWQVNTGSSWMSISNTGVYSGTTTAGLTITSATSGMNGYQYRCICTGSTSPAATSNAATLVVRALPTITSVTPDNVCTGQTGQVAAATSTGASASWYSAATGGTLLNTGTTYSIPNASSTATYYAQASISYGGGANTVTTLFNSNNGQRGTMFDVEAGAKPITVTNFDVNIYSGTTANYEIYYRSSTYVGNENSSTGWTQLGTASSVTSLGLNIATPLPIYFSVTIPANTRYSFYITNDFGGGVNYTDTGTVGNFWAGNSDATIYTGVGKSYPFSLTFTPRSINAIMHYTTGNGCVSAVRTGATLTVNPQPNITVTPPNRSITSGSNTTFGITATNTTGYQWQVSTNNGSTWSNVSNGGIYSSATTATLNITSATTTQNGYQYRAIATNTGGCADTSTGGILTITGTAPSITTQPTNRTICESTNTTFTIAASGTSLTYQWQVSANGGSTWNNVTNTGIYSGATTATLALIAATTAVNGNQYRCVATGSVSPPATSAAATLTINTAPSITTQPTNSTIGAGSNTSFSVAATGTGISYQWQVSTNNGSTWNNVTNTGIYSGAGTATLNLTAATATYNTYQYRCVVSGTCPSPETSNAATLTVNSAPAITGQPANRTICEGANTTFTVTASNAVSYQWQVSTNNGSTWNNLSNTGIYTGATTVTLTLTAATSVVNNNQYRCNVTGATTPNAISNTATLTFNASTAVTTQPTNSAICAGSNTSFNITATGAGISYQWEVSTNSGSTWSNVTNSGIYTGATTNTLNLTAVTSAVSSNQYRCVVNGTCPSPANSNAAILTINTTPAITAQPSPSAICSGNNASFSITATGTGLVYQWEVYNGTTWSTLSNTGIYSGVTTNTLNLTAATSTINNYQYRCVVTGTCPSSATSNAATININTAPVISVQPDNTSTCDGGNTLFAVTAIGAGLTYQWQVSTNNGSTWNNITNTGIYSGVTTSTLNLTGATASVNTYQYRCIISGTCGSPVNSNAATLSINSLLTINTQPGNTNICAAGNTSFTVAASGAGLTYQWQVSTNNGSTWNNISNTGIYSGATASTLNLTSVTGADNNNQYRCRISSTCAAPANSNAATLTINPAPAVTVQPANSTICNSANTTFSITATGTGINYQWEVYNGSTWNNVTNTGIYSGSNTNTLVLTAATTAVNNYQYRCVVTGACSPSATSNTGTLTINTAPVVTTQPINTSTCYGNNASFSVAAAGAGLGYQWQVSTNGGGSWNNVTNTGIYSGATANTLNLTGATSVVSNNQYRCIVSGTCGSPVNSSPATLSINSLLTINTQPANTATCSGNNTYLVITASGAGLTYQWQVSTNGGSTWNNITNTGIYSGAANDTLFLTTTTTAYNSYQYRCVVNSTCTAPENSNAATLTINNAPTITTQPMASTICLGANTSFSIAATGSGVTYQWEVNSGSGWNNVTNTGVYSGATSTTLNLTAPPLSTSTNQYRCVIGGSCVPGVTSNAVALTVNEQPAITAQANNSTICSGNNTSFYISATGTSLSYQWQVSTNGGGTWANVTNTGIYSGAATDSLVLTAATTAVNSYEYRCNVTGVCPPMVTSVAKTITVNAAPAINTQPVNRTICEGTNTTFTTSAAGTGLTYQWEVNSGSGWNNVANSSIYSGAGTNTLALTGPTSAISSYQYRCQIGGTCVPGITSAAVTLTVNTAPVITTQANNSIICSGNTTAFNIKAVGTALVYQWQVSTNGGSTWSNVTNSGIYSGSTSDSLVLTAATNAANNYQYRCNVSGTCPSALTSIAKTLTINTAPVINTQPVNRTICENTNTTFSIVATGTALTYQWEVNTGSGWNNVNNAGIYSGATTNTLTLAAATTAVHTNQYRCQVGGTCVPGLTSNPVTLTINTAPVVTASPTNSTICSGNNTSFSVSAIGTALSYQWQVSTNNGSTWNTVNNTGVYSGATTNTLSLTAATTANNTYQYRCVVSGICTPSATSSAAALTINALPAITTQPVARTICENTSTTFSITATGTGIGYQWQVSTNSGSTWTNINNAGIYSGATTNTLNLTAATTVVSNNQYRCIVGGTCTPNVTSAAVALTINTAPIVITQPADKTICEGLDHSFSISATGTAITYQWQVSINSGSSWSNIANGGVYAGTTTNTLSLSNIPSTNNNNQYRCIVLGSCVPMATSTTAVLTVNTNPVITTQPTDKTICSGDNTSYTIAATGTGLIYRWLVFNGSAWVNIPNTGIYSGATTNILNITGPVASTIATTYQYYCAVIGTCASTPSDTITLTVNARPKVTANPANKAVCDQTKNVTFDMDATGTGLNFIWQVSTNNGTSWSSLSNGTTYSGVLTKQLTVLQATYSMNSYQYRCVAVGKCTPIVYTTAATFTVYELKTPEVTITASDDDICIGTKVSFSSSVVNAGSTPGYDWRVNGISVGTGDSYSSSTLANLDEVTCVMTSSYVCPVPPTDTSNVIKMKVTPYSTPAITISSPTGNQGCLGRPVYFYSQSVNGGTGPTYEWQINGSPAGFDIDTFTTDLLQNGDIVKCIFTSNLKCPLPKTVTSNDVVMDVIPVTKAGIGILAGRDTIVCKNEEVILRTWLSNGGSQPKFQWILNGQDIPGKTDAVLKIKTLRDQDIIECRLTSSARCVFPEVSNNLSFDIGTLQPTSVDVTTIPMENNTQMFKALPTNGGAAPKYQWFNNTHIIPGATDSVYIATGLAPYEKISVMMVSSELCVTDRAVTSRNITTGIDAAEMSSVQLSLYPNPNKGTFTVNIDGLSSSGKAEIQVLNYLGQTIYENDAQLTNGTLTHQINIGTSNAAGAYMMNITIEGRRYRRSFVITE